MKKILIVQNYNANKGDSSVAFTMLKSLRAIDDDLDFGVTSYDPKKATEEYGIPAAEFAFNLHDIKLKKGISRIWAFAREGLWVGYGFGWAFFRRYLGIRLPVPTFKNKTVELYENTDVVVLPGGHFFTNFNGLGMNFSHFFAMILAFSLKKPTMIYAQTIGPFFGVFKLPVLAMTAFILRNVDAVTLREKGGLTYCNNVKRIELTAETVFALDTEISLAQNVKGLQSVRDNGEILVGVTIHHIYYKYFFSKDRYVSIMAEIFQRIVDGYNATILIIPMEEAVHGGGDRPLAREMIDRSGREKSVSILEGDLLSHVTAAVIASTDVFIGTKTHSVVYGLKSGVPTISISYQDKSNEFMQMFGVRENAINLKDITPDDFMQIFKRVFESLEFYRQKQQNALSRVKLLAEKNNHILLSLIK